MQSLLFTKLLLGLLFSDVVMSRALLGKRADLPACAQPCFVAAVTATGCAADDAPCICDSQPFYESMLACVLTTCGFADVSNLLSFGLDFCNRTGVNSAQRLGGVGNHVQISSTTETVPLPTTTPFVISSPTLTPEATVGSTSKTTYHPAQIYTSSEEVVSCTKVNTPPVETSSIVATTSSFTSTKTSSSAKETIYSVVSKSTIGSSANTESFKTTISSVAVSSDSAPTQPITISSGRFSVEPPSSTEEGSSLAVIQTANPISTPPQSAETSSPQKTSAPPTATADQPSSASASALHLFENGSFNSFVLCLVALFLIF